MSETQKLTEEQYAAVDEAMRRSKLGQSFLEEYARRGNTVSSDLVMGVLGEIKQAVAGRTSNGHIEILRRELQEMSASIVQTRREIAAIKPDEPGNNRIMAATCELDAIVTATERATSDILGSAEHVQDIAEKLRGQDADATLCDEIEQHMTDVFMACSFQDITGQRTTKVVNAMRYLEQRVNAMIEIWGVEGAGPVDEVEEPEDTRPDAHLLGGPQAEGEGVDQDEIDQILQNALG